MKIEILIKTNDDGTVRCSLQPPKPVTTMKDVTDDENKTCKVLWMKIDEMLLELSHIDKNDINK